MCSIFCLELANYNEDLSTRRMRSIEEIEVDMGDDIEVDMWGSDAELQHLIITED